MNRIIINVIISVIINALSTGFDLSNPIDSFKNLFFNPWFIVIIFVLHFSENMASGKYNDHIEKIKLTVGGWIRKLCDMIKRICRLRKGRSGDMSDFSNHEISKREIEKGRAHVIRRIVKYGFKGKKYDINNDLKLLKILDGIENNNLDIFLEDKATRREGDCSYEQASQNGGGNNEE